MAVEGDTFVTGQMVAVSVTVGAGTPVDLPVTGGNAERSVNLIRISNSKSGCYQVVVPGKKSARGTITCAYDGAEPPTIAEGMFVTLIVDATGSDCAPEDHPGGRLITIPALVVTVNDTWQTDGDYNWSFTYESSGAYSVVEPVAEEGGGGGGGGV